MGIMKLNGFSIKQLKNGLYIAINDNNPKIIKYGKDVNKLTNEIMKSTSKERENEET